MKKIICLFIITIFISSLTSCSEDQDDNFKVKLLTKVIEVNEDESTSTIDFTYDGNKIATIESEVSLKTFTYTGNLITKIVELDKTTQLSKTSDYIYDGDKLTSIVSSDNYSLNYIYNSNGSISYQKTTTDDDDDDSIILLEQGTLNFLNQNISENKKTDYTTGTTIIATETLSLEYDNKVNPLKNITGFSKLLDHFNHISSNNITKNTHISSTKFLETDEESSSLVYSSKNYNYDQDGYPKELISDKPLFETKYQKHVKSIYFYE